MKGNKNKDQIIICIFIATCFAVALNILITIDTQKQINNSRNDIIELINRYTLPLD